MFVCYFYIFLKFFDKETTSTICSGVISTLSPGLVSAFARATIVWNAAEYFSNRLVYIPRRDLYHFEYLGHSSSGF